MSMNLWKTIWPGKGRPSPCCPHHESDSKQRNQENEAKEETDLSSMLFCGPDFGKTTFFASINASGPHGVHATKRIFLDVIATAFWAHTRVLHAATNMEDEI
jgi:hypothetical protein